MLSQTTRLAFAMARGRLARTHECRANRWFLHSFSFSGMPAHRAQAMLSRVRVQSGCLPLDQDQNVGSPVGTRRHIARTMDSSQCIRDLQPKAAKQDPE